MNLLPRCRRRFFEFHVGRSNKELEVKSPVAPTKDNFLMVMPSAESSGGIKPPSGPLSSVEDNAPPPSDAQGELSS